MYCSTICTMATPASAKPLKASMETIRFLDVLLRVGPSEVISIRLGLHTRRSYEIKCYGPMQLFFMPIASLPVFKLVFQIRIDKRVKPNNGGSQTHLFQSHAQMPILNITIAQHLDLHAFFLSSFQMAAGFLSEAL